MRKLLVLLAIPFCLTSCAIKKYSSTNIEDYHSYIKKIYDADQFMPSIDDVGEYEEFLTTLRISPNPFLDSTHSIGLFLKYNEKNYNLEKEKINNTYYLLNNNSELPENYWPPLGNVTFYDNISYIKDFDAEINGYFIQIVYISFFEEYSFDYSDYFGMIGLNDKENKICYLYHHNGQTETINDLDKFIIDRYNFPN